MQADVDAAIALIESGALIPLRLISEEVRPSLDEGEFGMRLELSFENDDTQNEDTRRSSAGWTCYDRDAWAWQVCAALDRTASGTKANSACRLSLFVRASGMESGPVSLRLLEGEPSEMAELQRVFENAPKFAELVTGAPPGLADAQSTYSILPEGKAYDDKFVFGIFLGTAMVGCADVIRAYPVPTTAMLGLLLIAEPFQRRGIGRAAYAQLEDRVRTWGACERVRIGVIEANAGVMPFWGRLGFERTGETRPYCYGSVVSECIYFEKPLAWTSGSEAA